MLTLRLPKCRIAQTYLPTLIVQLQLIKVSETYCYPSEIFLREPAIATNKNLLQETPKTGNQSHNILFFT